MATEQQVAFMVNLHQEDTGIDASLALGFECRRRLFELESFAAVFKGLFALFEKILYI